MWLGELLASDAPANDSFVVVIGGIVVAAIGLLTAVLVEVVKGRNSRQATPAPPAVLTTSSNSVDVVALAADVAVLKDWRRETRKADDIHDRTLGKVVDDVEDLVRWNDREHPDWRP